MDDKIIIKLKDVTKVYGKGDIRVTALKGINIAVKKGEYLSIIGASGSGKSTLLNILGCLDTVTSGDYEIDNTSTQHISSREQALIRNQKIDFVFQSFNLLPRLTALKNVELSLVYRGVHKSERIQKSINILERIGLGDRLYHKPSELSGGQQQRVAIARALLSDPSIILADEPTGNLDSESSKQIMNLLDELSAEGKTILIVTHEVEIAQHTKRMIKMRDGLIIEDQEVSK